MKEKKNELLFEKNALQSTCLTIELLDQSHTPIKELSLFSTVEIDQKNVLWRSASEYFFIKVFVDSKNVYNTN